MNWNALLLSLLITAPVLGADFKEANRLYDEGKFGPAALIYEQIEPKTAHVYFNLGNALFRQEKYGLAVLNFERARRLAPRDPDILANLKFAQQHLGVDDLNQPPTAYRRLVQSVIASRTAREWSRYELAAMWTTSLALAGFIWLPRWRTGVMVLGIVAGIATVALAGALVAHERAAPAAIVIAGKAEARFAPSADATVHFQLPEGAKVSVREDRGEWVLVERADEQQGWVKAVAIEVIGTTTAK
jgi:hypothetical protein